MTKELVFLELYNRFRAINRVAKILHAGWEISGASTSAATQQTHTHARTHRLHHHWGKESTAVCIISFNITQVCLFCRQAESNTGKTKQPNTNPLWKHDSTLHHELNHFWSFASMRPEQTDGERSYLSGCGGLKSKLRVSNGIYRAAGE